MKILLFVFRFEVLTILSVKAMVFWEMTRHSLVDGYQCFALKMETVDSLEMLIPVYPNTWCHLMCG